MVQELTSVTGYSVFRGVYRNLVELFWRVPKF